MAKMTVIVKSIIERITILSPSIPVNRSIPEEINGTPNAKEVAAPPNSPNINKISTNLPKNLSVCPFSTGRQA